MVDRIYYAGMGDRVALLLWLKHRHTKMDLIGKMVVVMMIMIDVIHVSVLHAFNSLQTHYIDVY